MQKIIATVIMAAIAATFCMTGPASAESFPAMPQALQAMESDRRVTVSTIEEAAWAGNADYFYAFAPRYTVQTTAFIIYPGGLLDPRSYAPAARAFAEQGYLTFIVKMPLDLAVFGMTRAQEIIVRYPEIERWVIGGHSIGGSMACAYAHDNTDQISGVVLWAAWPGEEDRLDETDLQVISLYGTNDGFPDELAASAALLPEDTRFVVIQGGNHTQFGWYDTSPDPVQPNDHPADITREQQQAIIIRETAAFLDMVAGRKPCPAVLVLGKDSPWLATLRTLRDEVLMPRAAGRGLVRLYYEHAESMTAIFEEHQVMRKAARRVLENVLPAVAELLKD